MSMEQWRPVEGYEDRYEVSDQGRVRSLPGYRRRGGVRNPGVATNGYQFIGLWRDNEVTYARVHRLVATAFCERQSHQDVVRHLDGDQTNNAAENLAWGTTSDNAFDRVRHGTHNQAQKTHCAQGHEFTPDNIYWRGNYRRCRTCHRKGAPRFEPLGCGTRAAYARHRRNGEEPCARCREASRIDAEKYRQRKRAAQ